MRYLYPIASPHVRKNCSLSFTYRVSVGGVAGNALANADHARHRIDGEVGRSGIITDDVVGHCVIRSLRMGGNK